MLSKKWISLNLIDISDKKGLKMKLDLFLKEHAEEVKNKNPKCIELERLVYLQNNIALLVNMDECDYCVVVEKYNEHDLDNQEVNVEKTLLANKFVELRREARNVLVELGIN